MFFCIDELYFSDQFQSYLDKQTYKKAIRDREDYRHDVFAEIIASGAETVNDCRNAAQRVARQYRKDQLLESAMFDGSVVI